MSLLAWTIHIRFLSFSFQDCASLPDHKPPVGFRCKASQHAGSPTLPTFSDWVNPLFLLDPQETEDIVLRCWVRETYLSPATAHRTNPCLHYCWSSDRGTRGYFQGNLVSLIRWWSDLVWIHKCWWCLSAPVWCMAVHHKGQWTDKYPKPNKFLV